MLPQSDLHHIAAELDQLAQRMLAASQHVPPQIHPDFLPSAQNLLQYLAFRNFDLRSLQDQLSVLGLSSLGRIEGHALASLHAVRAVIARLIDQPPPALPPHSVGFAEGRDLLDRRTADLFGPEPPTRRVRVMVTLPSEAASDPLFARELIAAGMDCARVNCAHDAPDTWASMIHNVRAAARDANRPCRILMDLGGPKLRTGPIAPQPGVISWHPPRNRTGTVKGPAHVWLASPGIPAPDPSLPALPLPEVFVARFAPGDRLAFADARGKNRDLTLAEHTGSGWIAHAHSSAFITDGIVLTHQPASGDPPASATVHEIPPRIEPLRLYAGQQLLLTREPIPGEPAKHDADGRLLAPAHIACTLSELFRDARPGQPILFDDGQIGGVLNTVDHDYALVDITRTRPNGSKLRPDKGINLPETQLEISGLTPRDLADLDFVANHADLVSLSFAHNPADVLRLQAELARRSAAHVGIILKIETRRGFQQLPALMLTAMRTLPIGVMIARGDLAIECGMERLAELQEEMLWLCEAAHIPVIWATQVLESLAQKGFPSRAEITDAAMSQRSECVMLNKGPHIVETMHTLTDILRRMAGHQLKKSSRLRPLKVSALGDALSLDTFPPL